MDAYARKLFLAMLKQDLRDVDEGVTTSPPIWGHIGWMLFDPRPWESERQELLAAAREPFLAGT